VGFVAIYFRMGGCLSNPDVPYCGALVAQCYWFEDSGLGCLDVVLLLVIFCISCSP
jgi:hypothetical protein